jgi:hypothetical protein
VKTLFHIALLLSLGLSPVYSSPYSLVDLEALEKENSYAEFFQHALDIRPSERSEYWQTMVKNMAEGMLNTMLKKNRMTPEEFKMVESLSDWPVLKTDEFFKLKRQEVAIKWFSQCFSEDSAPESKCWAQFVEFWETEKQERDLTSKLLKLLTPYIQSTTPDVLKPEHQARRIVNRFFIIKPMVNSNLAELQCKKPEFQEILWEQLKKNWAFSLGQKSLATLLKNLASLECWKNFAPQAIQTWMKGDDSQELALNFELLKLLKKESETIRYLHSTHYLLTSPSKGDHFNIAWNRIQELGKKPLKREEIRGILEGWKSYPGETFKTSEQSKKNVIIRHFAKNFPEYLDLYSHTCIDFFSGKKSFPSGNPATNCRDFFELAASNKGIIPESLQKQFEAVVQ